MIVPGKTGAEGEVFATAFQPSAKRESAHGLP